MKTRSVLLFLLLLGLATANAMADARYQLAVDGLACPFCSYGIEKHLAKVDGVDEIDVNVGKGHVTVTMTKDAELTEDAAADAVDRAGFTLNGFKRLPESPEDE